MTASSLPVANLAQFAGIGEATLIALDGSPVWPLRNSQEREELHRVAALHNAVLEEVEAQPDSTAAGPGLVVTDDPQLTEAAKLYAHLTGRCFHPVNGSDHLPAATEIMVSDWRSLSFDRLDALQSLPSLPGLIVGDGPAGVHREVLRRSAAAKLVAPPGEVSLILPAAGVAGLAKSGLRICGGKAASEEVARALAASAVVGMFAHGDGLDARLAMQTALCATGALYADRQTGPPPDCVARLHCHRLNIPLTDLANHSGFVPAAVVTAPILLALTCFGIPATGSTTPWRWSLLRAWLEGGNVGAVVTPWGLCARMYGALLKMACALAEGDSLGTAVARATHEHKDDGGSTRLAIFGDPLVRVAPMRDAAAGLGALLAAMPASPSRSSPRPHRADRVATLRRLADFSGAPLPQTLRTFAGRQEHVLDALLEAKPYQCFSRLADSIVADAAAASCHLCSNPVRRIRQFLPAAEPNRVEHWCDRCGITLNREDRSRFGDWLPQLRGRTLMLPRSLVGRCVRTALMVEEPAALPPRSGDTAAPRLLLRVTPPPDAATFELPHWEGSRRWTLLAMLDDEIVLFQGLA